MIYDASTRNAIERKMHVALTASEVGADCRATGLEGQDSEHLIYTDKERRGQFMAWLWSQLYRIHKSTRGIVICPSFVQKRVATTKKKRKRDSENAPFFTNSLFALHRQLHPEISEIPRSNSKLQATSSSTAHQLVTTIDTSNRQHLLLHSADDLYVHN